MTATTAATSQTNGAESEAGVTSLAERLRADGPEDHRPCPHDCPGSLSLAEDGELVVCQVCRVSPDGVYHPPPERTSEIGSRRREGWGREGENGSVERDRYRYSNTVRLAGGYVEAYPHEWTTRSDSIL